MKLIFDFIIIRLLLHKATEHAYLGFAQHKVVTRGGNTDGKLKTNRS